MTELADAIAVTRASFVDQLLAREARRAELDDLLEILGIDILAKERARLASGDLDEEDYAELKRGLTEVVSNDIFVCEVHADGKSHRILIWLTDGFPFSPPDVYAERDFPRSWHRNRDGTLCLYPTDERGGLPWLDVDALFELLQYWFDQSVSGWKGDFPLLDIEAYIPQSSGERRLVLYGNLERLTWVRFEIGNRTIRLEGRGRRPASTLRVPSTTVYGYVADIGEPEAPPRSWDDLASLLGRRASFVRRAICAGDITILLVRYRREGQEGVLVLHVSVTQDAIEISSLRGASDDIRSTTLRAGEFAPLLRGKRVLVVGVGAVGSHVADSLARAGVGSLGLMDVDDVKPGNLVRHVATEKHIGWSKPTAVKDVIMSRLFNVTDVEALEASLVNPEHAVAAVRDHDLVVDATANGSVTAMLHHAAIAEGAHIVSACLKENGSIVRVDILPPIRGESLPEPAASVPGAIAVGYEAGCYAAVSLTPHAAVLEAAALAVRSALNLLLEKDAARAGVERDYR